MTTATPVKPAQKLLNADPGIYPWEITEGRYAGRMGVYVPTVYMPQLEEIPGARYSKADEVWTLPKAWPAVLSLGEMKRRTKLPMVAHPALRAWVADQAAHWARMTELALTIRTDAVKGADDLFYPHQDDDAAWLSYGDGLEPTPGRLLLSETGIGKTAGVIAGMLRLNLPERGPVLICAPRRTLKKAWADDLEKFMPGVSTVLIRGSVTQRRKQIQLIKDGEAQIGIIGWESMRSHTKFAPFPGKALKRCPACGGPKLAADLSPEQIKALPEDEQPVTELKCQAHAKELNDIGWALIVGDELHRAMNSGSQTAHALWGLVAGAPGARHWGLTGTPISKDVEQSWSLLHYADTEAWPVKSTWTSYYAQTGYNMAGYMETLGLRPERQEEFQATFKAVTRRVLKAQVLNLPPLLIGGGLVREIEMGTEQAKAYRQMKEEMVAWVKEGKITAANVLVAAGRLTLMAQATGYPDDESAAAKPGSDDIPVKMLLRMPSAKVTEVVADLTSGEFDGHQVAVSMESRRLLRLLEAELHRAGVGPEEIGIIAGDVNDAASEMDIDQFQAGKKRIMLYTYAAGGTGLTLTAASYLLRVQRSWSPILAKQGLDRVHRIGSEKHESISVIDYLTTGTIEEKQLLVAAKDADLLEQVVQDKVKLLDLFGG